LLLLPLLPGVLLPSALLPLPLPPLLLLLDGAGRLDVLSSSQPLLALIALLPWLACAAKRRCWCWRRRDAAGAQAGSVLRLQACKQAA
jgi:hypothetical protein